MAKNESGEKKTRAPRTPRPIKAVLVFDDFDGKTFHGLSVHRIDAGIVNVITEAATAGRKMVQVEIPPASSGE